MIYELIKKAETNSNFPPTLLYNEGWMLRLVLQLLNNKKTNHKNLFSPNEFKWYSEALLTSPFLPRHRGDKLAESHTHADGVVGKFKIQKNTRSGVELKDYCDFFYVIEAKMFSRLSKGISNAENYNQAARNVACLAKLIYDNRKTIEISEIDKFGFYIFLPEEQKKNEPTFTKFTEKPEIIRIITERISMYKEEETDEEKIDFSWLENNLETFINKLDIQLITWEEILGKRNDSEIWKFYDKCIEYNNKKQKCPNPKPLNVII